MDDTEWQEFRTKLSAILWSHFYVGNQGFFISNAVDKIEKLVKKMMIKKEEE